MPDARSGWLSQFFCAPMLTQGAFSTMNTRFSRRQLGRLAPLALPLAVPVQAETGGTHIDNFPAQPPEVVREMVSVSHGNVKRVKELVEARPALAKAAIDWGFGDWEDALGAASHMGNRAIAEYLLSKGARPSIFSAAMLGQLEGVRAFITAQPGVQRTAGPHSISLLSHAPAGGQQAQAVFDYLNALGDAGEPVAPQLTEEQAAHLAGIYTFADQRIDITRKGTQL